MIRPDPNSVSDRTTYIPIQNGLESELYRWECGLQNTLGLKKLSLSNYIPKLERKISPLSKIISQSNLNLHFISRKTPSFTYLNFLPNKLSTSGHMENNCPRDRRGEREERREEKGKNSLFFHRLAASHHSGALHRRSSHGRQQAPSLNSAATTPQRGNHSIALL